ncbi:MAG TPA: CAP domain-containing protein [Herpetosiphonaceae bacterium]|nr:CAP domain-containing protein [Herpetosiphonaceae bacterium]
MIRKRLPLIMFVTLFVPALCAVAAPREVEVSAKRIRIFLPLVRSDAAPRQVEASARRMGVVELVNVQRAAAGVAPLTVNAILMNEAQRFSAVQAEMGTTSHGGNDGSTPGQRLTAAGYIWSFCGENLAAGQRTAAEVVAFWMNSATHRATLLSPEAAEIGIGHSIRVDDPSGLINYYVMEVARPR